MKVDLAGRTALVTGGGRGIGRGIATTLVENGANVLIATRTAASGQAVVDELNGNGPGRAALKALDLSTRDACSAAVTAAVDAFGQLDILVHNAAIFPFTLVEKLEDAEFDGTLKANLYSMLWLTQAALPHLKQSRAGRVVAISSVIGNLSSLPGMSSYAASKGGLEGLSRNLALELSPHRITLNIIEPGLIIDDRDPRMDEATSSQIVANIPLARAGLPSDIAAATLFFVSDAAEFITGQTLVVDGGMHVPDHSVLAMRSRV
ncbi:MAG: SDR family oxidoreductase [Sphingomonadaceae bacterium]|nr:SDR family oxidoreductase [Sphingomonadaceae bacterium]